MMEATSNVRVVDGGAAITVVQFSEPRPLPETDVDPFVANLIADALASTTVRPKDPKAWVFYLATERPHVEGLHLWVGVGEGVPAAIVDDLQSGLDARGCTTRRDRAVIARHALRPLLAITATGVEVPSRASALEDATLHRLATSRARTPFVVDLEEAFKKDLLAAMLLGDGASVPFHLPYYQDDDQAVFSFGRVGLQMFARHADGSYTALTMLASTPPCVLGFDFGDAQLEQLFGLLPAEANEGLARSLLAGEPFRVPPGTVVVGVRARAGTPGPSESTSFDVEAFLPSRGPGLAVHF